MNRARHNSRARWVHLALFVACATIAGCGDDDEGRSATPTPVHTATAQPRSPTAASTSTAIASSTPSVVFTASPRPTSTPTPPVELTACEKLANCDQCFTTQRGTCLDAAQCAGRLSEDAARCINQVSGCNQAGLGDCLVVGCSGDGTGECE